MVLYQVQQNLLGSRICPLVLEHLDSCHGRVIQNQQKFVSYTPPTVVVKLLQYSDLGSNMGMGFHPTNDSHHV